MTIKLSRNSNWPIAQRLRVFRDAFGSWTNARKVFIYRGTPGTGFWSQVYPDAPFANSTPALVGTAIVGQTLSLSTTTFWDTQLYRAPETITYQWQRSTDEVTWNNIASATNSTYVVQSADNNNYLRCRITATNALTSTSVNTNRSQKVIDPQFIFQFGTEFAVNSNGFIMFDRTGASYPIADTTLLAPGRILGYFMGSYKHYRTWYKSDATTFRVYHQMWRTDLASRPASPNLEIEIVFTAGSNLVDIYVVNPIATQYIIYYIAYMSEYTTLSNYPSHLTNIRYRVTMNSPSSVSTASGSPSTTSPSILTGWINIDSNIDTEDTNVVFNAGTGQFSPILPNINGAFTKSNMFFPSTPTLTGPTFATSSTASLSWSGSNANSYSVTVTRTSDSVQVFSQTTTSTSITLSNLVTGTEYSVSVSPNSRSDVLGQFGFAATKSYTHAGLPGAPTGLATSGTPTDDGLYVTWQIVWTAPTNTGGSALTNYEYALDLTADNGIDNYGSWLSNGGTTTSRSIQIIEGNRAKIKIRAVNGAGAGPESTELIIPSTPTVPGTPSATTASGGTSTISWTASNVNGGSSLVYNIYRGQNTTTVANLRNASAQSSTNFTDNIGGNGATTYYYKVTPLANYGSPAAQLTGIDSAVSSGLSITAPTVNAPVGLVQNSPAGILLAWSGSAGSGDTLTYSLYRGQNTNPTNLIANQTSTSFTDQGVSASTTYYYRVSGTNNVGTAQSNVSSSITTPGPPNAPGTPSGAANNINNNIALSWSAAGANNGGTVTYEVFRGQNTANVNTSRGTTTGTQLTDPYSHTGTATYYYRVVPSTVWGTGPTSGTSAGITAS